MMSFLLFVRRSAARRNLGLVVAATCVVSLLSGAPAQAAVAPFGPATKIAPAGCVIAKLSVDSVGTARGFVSCNSSGGRKVMYVQGAGATWRSTDMGTGGRLEVLDAADDGINTYALVYGGWGSDTMLRVRVLIRSHTGAVSMRALATVPVQIRGSIIGYGGKWWAVWSVPNGDCTCNQLWTARTMLTAYSAHNTNLKGMDPSLANRGSSAILIWSAGYGFGGRVTYGYPSTTTFTALSTGLDGVLPTISAAGGMLRITYLDTFRYDSYTYSLQYRELVNGVWAGTRLATSVPTAFGRGADPEFTPAHLVVSGTTVSLAWTTMRTAGAYVQVGTRTGTGAWSFLLMSDGLSSTSHSTASWLGSVNGKLVVGMTHVTPSYDTMYEVSRRQ